MFVLWCVSGFVCGCIYLCVCVNVSGLVRECVCVCVKVYLCECVGVFNGEFFFVSLRDFVREFVPCEYVNV